MSALDLEITRSPYEDHHHTAEETFAARLAVQKITEQHSSLRFNFVTNPDGQRKSFFDSYINPQDFAHLASMMVEADPETAIKAFGIALQHAQIIRRESRQTGKAA